MFQGLRTFPPYAPHVMGLHRYVPKLRHSNDMTKIFFFNKKAKSQCLGKGSIFFNVFKLKQLLVNKTSKNSRSLILLENELTQHSLQSEKNFYPDSPSPHQGPSPPGTNVSVCLLKASEEWNPRRGFCPEH